MMRWLTFTLTLTLLMSFTTLAAAQQKAQEKTAPVKLDKPVLQKLHPDLFKSLSGRVTQVNPTANTFTVTANGKAVTFTAAKLKALPKVGENVEITYTQTPGGPMEATTVRGSKSNSDN